jgi:hypothetical protein
MSNLSKKIKQCKTKPELDNLRVEIVSDINNFEQNQKEFIKKLNQLRRIPLRERTW